MSDNKVNVLEEYLEKAKNGDVNAQFKIAWAYDQGEGVEQDYVEANKWWLRAAEQGNRVAQYNLAINLKNARGINQPDYETAFKWNLESANRGYTKAFFKVAWAYDQGEGAAQDYVEANKWYLKAAQQGDKVAQYNLAQNKRHGRGTPCGQTDCEAAEYWYKESAANGYQKANDRLRELEEEKKVLAGFQGVEIINYHDSTAAMKSYQEICDILNEIALLGEAAPQRVIKKAIEEFIHTWTQCLIDEFLATHSYLDLIESGNVSDEEKREILLLASSYGIVDSASICNALSKLKSIKCEVANYEEIGTLVNEIAMQWCFSRKFELFFQDDFIYGYSFIYDRYKWMINALLKDKKDIVALYSRQILNYILKDSYRLKSRRIDWPDKEIDIVKKIELLERGNYISKEMIQKCHEVRCSTNLGHHITTANEWSKWDDISCIETTIQLMYFYLKEIKGNSLIVVHSRRYKEKDLAYGLNFWKRNHVQKCFVQDEDLNQYTAEELAISNSRDMHAEAAVYGRRLLEMWIKQKFDTNYPGYLFPEGKENILEEINFLHERNIISDIEKSIAHEIRRECNGAMHIENDGDEVCSASSVFRDIERLINPKGLSEETSKIRRKRKEYWALVDKYDSIVRKKKEESSLKEQKAGKKVFVFAIVFFCLIAILYVFSIFIKIDSVKTKNSGIIDSYTVVAYSEGKEIESTSYGLDDTGKLLDGITIETGETEVELLLEWGMTGQSGVCGLKKLKQDGVVNNELEDKINLAGSVTLDEDGNMTKLIIYMMDTTLIDTVRIYESGVLRSEESNLAGQYRSKTIYNEEENPVEYSNYSLQTDELLEHKKYLYEYDNNKIILSCTVNDDVSGTQYVETYQYDENGILIKKQRNDGIYTEYKYDDEGYITEVCTYGADGVISSKTIYTYYYE